jgi:glucan phosphoethanolaminetransferase (alkaline phosphatase superfamily)
LKRIPQLKGFHRIKALLISKEFRASVIFACGLALFEALLLKVSYAKYLTYFRHGDYVLFTGALVIILASLVWLVLFLWSSLTATRPLKLAYWFVFSFIVLVQYSYQRALGRFVSLDDASLALFATDFEIKRNMTLAYFSWIALIPSFAYAFLLLNRSHIRQTGWKTFLGVVALAFCLYTPTARSGYSDFTTSSVNAFFRTWTESIWRWRYAFPGPREVIAFKAVAPPKNNIVLIVDESVRADHLSLNGYPRATTPYLDELNSKGALTNWGLAVSGTNCSRSSNALMLTGFPPSQLPDTEAQIKRWPSIFQYAQAMGYKTYYIDGQLNYFWNGTSDDLHHIDVWWNSDQFPIDNLSDRDFVIARKVVELVDGSTGNFIWINKRGVHFPYFDDFPENEAIWKPLFEKNKSPNLADKEPLANSYDDALRYNLEGFFRTLDVTNRGNNTIFFYTSDHGQNLSEGGEVVTHCGDIRNGRENLNREVLVPILMMAAGEHARDTSRRLNKVSHYNIFATLLDLMRFPAEQRLHQYGQSLLEDDNFQFQKRCYFAGDGIDKHVLTGGLLCFDE